MDNHGRAELIAHFKAQAAQCRCFAEDAPLANLKTKWERAAKSWDDMAAEMEMIVARAVAT